MSDDLLVIDVQRIVRNTATVVTVRRSLRWRLRRPWVRLKLAYYGWRLDRRMNRR